MSDTWIGTTVLTAEDAIYDEDGNKLLDLLDRSSDITVDEDLYPVLASISTTYTAKTSPDSTGRTSYKVIADLTETETP